jgi:hypothetical protein
MSEALDNACLFVKAVEDHNKKFYSDVRARRKSADAEPLHIYMMVRDKVSVNINRHAPLTAMDIQFILYAAEETKGTVTTSLGGIDVNF